MADQEGFEDDLFADLYTDDDGAKPVKSHADTTQPVIVAPAAPAPAAAPESTPATATAYQPVFASNDEAMPSLENGAQDDEYEEEEDDDDIDITLGSAEPPAAISFSHTQNDRASTPALSVHGLNKQALASKEDG